MATEKLNLTVGPPSFGGHHECVVVGGRKFGLPPDTAVRKIRSRDGHEIAYTLHYDNSLHVLCNRGEIGVPQQLVPEIIHRYFPKRAPREGER
jgi:hypothetical protein